MNKFLLETSGYLYDSERKEKLEKYGFKFYPDPTNHFPERLGLKWRIDDDYYPEIELNSMEELLDFLSEIKYPIIIHGHTIEIYDEHRE